ncbi:MAG: 50S ribosomal protein L35 [Oligoflexia bacterium]|nr:50S ribosomal protein L35 [Oligoflexia bacterium]
MPKMKTNRLARKKFRVGGTGTIKRGQAGTSHNTGKKSAKRKRHLRPMLKMDKTNVGHAKRQLPYLRTGH